MDVFNKEETTEVEVIPLVEIVPSSALNLIEVTVKPYSILHMEFPK